jgi:hypothetical protein
MRTIVSTAVGCLVASLAFAAVDANAAIAPLPAGQMYRAQPDSAGNFATALTAPSGAAFATNRAAEPIMVARRGADNPPGDVRRGRGMDNAVVPTSQGAANPPSDVRRGRGKDNAVVPASPGADNPPGDVRRGRGKDDPLPHL